MKTTFSNSLQYILAAAVLLGAAYLFISQSTFAHASAPSGLPATVATTSNPTVGTTPSLVFSTSTCAARIVSTGASPIMMTLTDAQGQTPSGTFGILQAASTTVAYDSGQYGCGAVRVYSFASGAITVMESR